MKEIESRQYPAKNPTMAPIRRAIIAFALLVGIIFLFRPFSTSDAAYRDGFSQGQKPLRIPPQARGRAGTGQSQLPVGETAYPTLLEKLRYQYPYDLDSKFPAYIWQTWKDSVNSNWFPDHLRPLEASWTERNPEFVHEVISDEAADHLVQYLYGSVPEVVEAYNSLPAPVLKADLFRYLILLARGGIYSDIDTEALKPAIDWLPDDMDPSSVGLVIGIEADPDRPDWHEWYSRRIQFCQWTIQAKPGHPVLRDVVATIVEDTLRMKRKGVLTKSKMDKSIVEFTGPAVWTDAVFRYFNNPDYFLSEGTRNVTYEDFTGLTRQKKVGDVAVLPITSFSPGVGQMGAQGPEDPLAFVSHLFEGSWKPESERIS
ncbi:alpha-1,6-mannosyltransferase subunit (Och1), putative [Talaromyces stipitatus ATCC 10500]|uniref:Alpha-1,6-mannosyltransferase subunit (Och1), putative n=1 Tax=Talaromyces stipitatus (strain ATCC 10500 / CBS 375.48 / QM 6759 / NRRL 1006) TaxID=441959 RepID=B8MD91_TALSN|nr:alpha-1,6-mannosyltransferase subunit (Och1), putative [Talaromyces stipitatus ATCC 10500]EED17616.1 alpha-1,6-mannosyltransferase subunit (Och1), putative [Talaromyces stipitatus ATCC 10500]